MKESRIHYNFQLPKAYDKVIWHIYALLQKDPKAIGKLEGYRIKKTDIFKYIFDMVADQLEIDLKIENGFTIEIVDPVTKKNKDIDLTNLARIMSSKHFRLQEEFLFYHKDDMTLFEFCDMRGLDWKALLKEDKREIL